MTFRVSATVLVMLLALASSLPAYGQSVSQLQQDNARLRAQLEALQAQGCGIDTPADGSHRGNPLVGTIDAVRVGPATGYASGHVAVTVVMTLRNAGNAPLALNYQKGSFSVTDDRGYQYELRHEHSSTRYSQDVKGIPMATANRADTTSVIQPGGRRTITFIGTRYMKDGQTPGHRFDINATFVALEDLGQGSVRKVRDFPVAFTNVRASGK